MKKKPKTLHLIIQKIFDAIIEYQKECPNKKFVFRGENQAYEKDKVYKKVSCSLYRTHESILKKYKNSLTAFNEFQKDIIENAKRHFPSPTSKIDILTELQHYGGKTSLIDFSKDFYIALFFACHGEHREKDGRLIVYPCENIEPTPTDELFEEKQLNDFCFEPNSTNTRIVFQKSAFVHASQGIVKEETYKQIDITSNDKSKILEYLKEYHDIHEKTIYNDLQGFIANTDNFKTAKTYFFTGLLHQENRKYKEAIKSYQKALEIKPDFAEAHYNMGLAYAELTQYDKAIECYQQALTIQPDYHEAHYNMGNAYAELKEYDKAIECYRQALTIKPDKHEAYYNMGNAYVQLKQYDKAIECFQQALTIKPDIHEAYNNMGLAYAELKQYDKAIECFQQALTIKPNYHEALHNLNVAKSKLQK